MYTACNPGLNPAGLAVKVTSAGVIPVVGVTLSHDGHGPNTALTVKLSGTVTVRPDRSVVPLDTLNVAVAGGESADATDSRTPPKMFGSTVKLMNTDSIDPGSSTKPSFTPGANKVTRSEYLPCGVVTVMSDGVVVRKRSTRTIEPPMARKVTCLSPLSL